MINFYINLWVGIRLFAIGVLVMLVIGFIFLVLLSKVADWFNKIKRRKKKIMNNENLFYQGYINACFSDEHDRPFYTMNEYTICEMKRRKIELTLYQRGFEAFIQEKNRKKNREIYS